MLIDAAKVISLVLDSPISENPLTWMVNYTDQTSVGVVIQCSTVAGSLSAGIGVIVPAPLNPNLRDIVELAVFNADTAPATLTVRLTESVSIRPLYTVTLNPNDQLLYTSGKGWTVQSGGLKVSLDPPFDQGVVNDSPQTYFEGDIAPLSLNSEGRLRVSMVQADVERIWQAPLNAMQYTDEDSFAVGTAWAGWGG